MRTRSESDNKFVRTICALEVLNLNWFQTKKAFSHGIVEGMNRRINLVTREAYSFQSHGTVQQPGVGCPSGRSR